MPQTNWQTIALLVVTVGFFAMVLARTWPRFGRKRNVPLGAALKAARTKIEAAKTDAEKANALCEAADACALAFGRSEAAASYYLRAMRITPASAELVERAIQGLEHRPRALESLLWRKLGADPEHAPSPEATRAALQGLEKIYAARPRHAVRARAVGTILKQMK
ncbi:MAG TPA: hypothetical protein VGH87_17370 [Polyangiaceae bacterium]